MVSNYVYFHPTLFETFCFVINSFNLHEKKIHLYCSIARTWLIDAQGEVFDNED